MRFVTFFMVLAAFSATAHAGKKFSAWPAWKEFKGFTEMQMKDLPDVKVSMGKPLTAAALKKKTVVEIVLMKNSIFAQKGFAFTTPYLKNYFMARSWYKTGDYKPEMLTKVDRDNAKMINATLAKLSGHQKARHISSTPKKNAKKNAEKDKGYDGYDGYDGYGDDYGYGEDYGYEEKD